MKKIIIKYAVAFAVAGAIVVLVLWGQGFFTQTLWSEQCKNLCDAFTFSGLLFILVGALVWVSNKGAFLGIGFAINWLVYTLIPLGKKKHETYADYRERKIEKGGIKGYSFLFFTGLAYFVVAIIFLILFYTLP